MTLNADDVRNEYTANAGQTIFNYTFKIYSTSDLDVYVTPSGQACSSTDLTTAYTVSGVGNKDGGSISLSTATSSGDLVTIVSSIPTSRTTDYQNSGDFRPDTVNDDFDRTVSLVKQVEDLAKRGLSFDDCAQGVSGLSLASPSAGEYLRWNGSETGVENAPVPTISTSTGTISVNDYAALKALTGQSNDEVVSVGYRSSENDGGGGLFRWDGSDNSSSVTLDPGQGIYVPPTSDATGASGSWVRIRNGQPLNLAWWPVVSDWNGSTGTNNTTAVQDCFDYAFDSGIHEVELPAGSFLITNVRLKSANNYSTAGLSIKGKGIRATTFYSDTSRPIEILPSDGFGGSATAYNIDLRDFSVRNGTTNPTNGIFAEKLAFSQFHNINVSGFDRCFYLTGDSFLNRFTKLYMSGTHEYGFRMGASGTTNYWDQCYDFGASVRAYALTGSYSTIGAIAADQCTGDYTYDFSFFTGHIGSLGNESSDVLRMITVQNSDITIGYALAFDNTIDPANNKGGLIRGTGSKIKLDSFRVEVGSANAPSITGVTQANPAVVTSNGHGFSTGDSVTITDVSGMTELNFNTYVITVIDVNSFSLDSTDSTGFTAYTSGGTATFTSTQSPFDFFETSFEVGHITYTNVNFSGEPGGSSSDNNAYIVKDGGTEIAVSREGTRRSYLGYDRGSLAFPDSDHRIRGTLAVPKAIFLDMVGNPRFDSDGNDYNTGRPARIGDVFLESDPADNHQFARIIDSTGTTLSACTSLRVPIVLVGPLASRPTSGLWDGLEYKDTTNHQTLTWYDPNWYDETGTVVP